MKALIIGLCLFPVLSFGIERCEKEISPTEKLIYKVNNVLLSPLNTDGTINLDFYKDIVAKNKFAPPKADVEEYRYSLKSNSLSLNNYWGIFTVYTTTYGDTLTEVKTINHKSENLEKQKKELLELLNNTVQAVPMQDNNAVALVTKDGRQAIIDFRLPMIANPVVMYTKNNVRSLASITGPGVVYGPLLPNRDVSEAVTRNQYYIEECDEKVYTKITTKEKTVMGIKYTMTQTKVVDESKNTNK